jgi:hypothetical protein
LKEKAMKSELRNEPLDKKHNYARQNWNRKANC